MFDSIQTAMAYAGGETDTVRHGASRALATDTGQGNRRTMSSGGENAIVTLHVIEQREAAIAAVPGRDSNDPRGLVVGKGSRRGESSLSATHPQSAHPSPTISLPDKSRERHT